MRLTPTAVCARVQPECGRVRAERKTPISVPASPASTSASSSSSPPAKSAHIGSEIECLLCEYIIHEVEQYVDGNNTLPAVEEALDWACHLLPGTLKNDCLSAVATYAPVIVAILQGNPDPKAICADIKLCASASLAAASSSSSSAHAAPQLVLLPPVEAYVDAVNGFLECETCKYFVGDVEKRLDGNTTLPAVTHALDQVCKILPGDSLKQLCRDGIAATAPWLVEVLQSNPDPESICALVSLCNTNATAAGLPQHVPAELAAVASAAAATGKQQQLIEKHAVGANAVVCEVCEYVIHIVDIMLDSNTTQTHVIEVLDDVCQHAGGFSATCQEFVNKYGGEVLAYIVAHDDPLNTCTGIHLCDG